MPAASNTLQVSDFSQQLAVRKMQNNLHLYQEADKIQDEKVRALQEAAMIKQKLS